MKTHTTAMTMPPSTQARSGALRTLGLDPGGFHVGIVGRLNPVKDHATLLRAFLLSTYAYQLLREGTKWLVGHKRPLRAERIRAVGIPAAAQPRLSLIPTFSARRPKNPLSPRAGGRGRG